ncbi:amine oxidase, flavin-containing superfamily [Aspergillus mulundensis]|uniref:Amine oxidase domain-containing protein n=1 Tax=Aspergillus mulundensis TaxID=1810919 RepID=A0A3D8T3D6_9EURO|nr:hypothetical protein DSM5745_00372 [Aspergillus mulundensis]RDW93050.1 hypothetical protein DSM5745_00372 [Aspergillus mulundensis]
MRFSTGTRVAALASVWLSFTSALPGLGHDNDDVITRDVAIIGGGASGTYAAIRLRELGRSVALIEQRDELGGHTHTYYDAAAPIDYGVWIYTNNTDMERFFAHFNIPLVAEILNGDPAYTRRYDFRTGEAVAALGGNIIDALTRYVGILLQHPYLAGGFDLPDPVPEDLLLSFGDLIEKYDLGAAVDMITQFDQGFAENILDYPSIYILKYLDLAVIQGIQFGFSRPASRANQDLYKAAEAELGEDALLGSTVARIQRQDDKGTSAHHKDTNAHHKGTSAHHIVVDTPSGKQRIIANKVIVAIPPLLENLDGFDLDDRESDIFSRFQYSSYYGSVVNVTGLPRQLQIFNKATDTPYHVADLPGTFTFNPTAVEGIHTGFFGGGAGSLPEDQARQGIIDNLLALRNAGYPVSEPEIIALRSHTPFGLHVSAEEIAGGFYRDLYGLQGYRGMYYTGAAFHAHNSAELWEFTERVLQEHVLVD